MQISLSIFLIFGLVLNLNAASVTHTISSSEEIEEELGPTQSESNKGDLLDAILKNLFERDTTLTNVTTSFNIDPINKEFDDDVNVTSRTGIIGHARHFVLDMGNVFGKIFSTAEPDNSNNLTTTTTMADEEKSRMATILAIFGNLKSYLVTPSSSGLVKNETFSSPSNWCTTFTLALVRLP